MNRQALRNEYPFHARNPRASTPCCARRTFPRRSRLQKLIDAFARLVR